MSIVYGNTTVDRIAASTSDILLLAARILIGWIFVRSGFGKIADISAFSANLGRTGVPFAQVVAPVEFFGGIALVIGLQLRIAALLMFLFVVVATLLSHRYWEFTEAAARRAQDTNFYKNAAIAGGIIALWVAGSGRLAADALWRRARR